VHVIKKLVVISIARKQFQISKEFNAAFPRSLMNGANFGKIHSNAIQILISPST